MYSSAFVFFLFHLAASTTINIYPPRVPDFTTLCRDRHPRYGGADLNVNMRCDTKSTFQMWCAPIAKTRANTNGAERDFECEAGEFCVTVSPNGRDVIDPNTQSWLTEHGVDVRCLHQVFEDHATQEPGTSGIWQSLVTAPDEASMMYGRIEVTGYTSDAAFMMQFEGGFNTGIGHIGQLPVHAPNYLTEHGYEISYALDRARHYSFIGKVIFYEKHNGRVNVSCQWSFA